MFCRSCGTSLFGSESACSGCGAEVLLPAAVAAPAAVQTPRAEPAAGGEGAAVVLAPLRPEPPAESGADAVKSPSLQPAPEPNVARCGSHPERPAAGVCPRCGTFVCTLCKPDLLFSTAVPGLPCVACLAREEVKPERIGGWLILPAIGLVLTPPQSLWRLYHDFAVQMTDGTFDKVAALYPNYAGVFAFEALTNLGLLVFLVYVAINFFGRRRRAPKLMVIWYLCVLVIECIDAALVSSLGPDFNTEGVPPFVGSTIRAAIWIPYFLTSERVRNTFTR